MILHTHYFHISLKNINFVQMTQKLFLTVSTWNQIECAFGYLKAKWAILTLKRRFDPFVPDAPFAYPLKTSQNLTVIWYFQGVEKGCIGNEWFKVRKRPRSVHACFVLHNVCERRKSYIDEKKTLHQWRIA